MSRELATGTQSRGEKRMSIFFLSATLCLGGMFLAVDAQRAKSRSRSFVVDATQSQINIVLAQEGLIRKRYPSHRIVAKAFSGKIDLPREEARLKAEVEAEVNSLTNVDELMSEFERKEFHHSLRNQVLEAEKFPAIKFASVSVAAVKQKGEDRSFTLTGDLMMHGVTKRISFPVEVTISADQIRATGEARLKQTDFAMKPFEKGMGLIRVGDELSVNFQIIAKAAKL
jgi:polyisoprenoid-binding protein YceI